MSDAHQVLVDWGTDARGSPDEADIIHWIEHALDGLIDSASVDVRIVDHDQMRSLNRQYRDKDQPTNVLSFPADIHPDVPVNLLGDLVVCAPLLASEARDQGKCLDHHWAHILTHGTLHLLGYDHIKEADAEVMESLERAILARLDIDDPYRTDPTGREPHQT